MTRKLIPEDVFSIALLILFILVIGGIVGILEYVNIESHIVIVEISDEFGNIIQMNESYSTKSNIKLNINSEIIKIKLKNKLTGKPIRRQYIYIDWLPENPSRSNNEFYFSDRGYTNQDGEIKFFKSNATLYIDSNDYTIINPMISTISIYFNYKGTDHRIYLGETPTSSILKKYFLEQN